MCRLGVTVSVMTRVRNTPGVLRRTCRAKISATRSGRPMSRLSRMVCSKKIRPETGLSSTWVSENSGLHHRELVAVAGGPVRGGERVRQPGQPLADQLVDGLRGQAVADRLHRRHVLGVVDGGESVVQRG